MWEIWRCIFSLIFCECKYIVTCYVLCILALLYLMGLISVFFLQVKVSRSDSSQLTAEERRNLVTITAQQSDLLFHHSSLSHLENEATEERNLTVHVLNYTVPENGVIDVEFPILSDTKTLRVQVLLCKVLLGSVDTLNCVGWDQWWAVLLSATAAMSPIVMFVTLCYSWKESENWCQMGFNNCTMISKEKNPRYPKHKVDFC